MEKCFKMFLAAMLIIAGGVSAQINWRADNITIKTEEELRELARLVNSGARNFNGQSITLANDINLKNGEWIPIGNGDKFGDDIINFKGTFDGYGKVIRGINIDSQNSFQGFFGVIGTDAMIINLGVVVNIKGGTPVGGLAAVNHGVIANSQVEGIVKGEGNVGGLVGVNFSTIDHCYTSVSVTGDDVVGGLVGDNKNTRFNVGRIINSYSLGSVTARSGVGGLVGVNNAGQIISSYAAGNVTGTGNSIGGLVGQNSRKIENSYAIGSVSGNNVISIGGLVGSNLGTIENCYALGSVVGTGNCCIGELVGRNAHNLNERNPREITNGYVIGCYALSANVKALVGDRKGIICRISGVKTATQMKQQNTFADWDFTNLWRINANTNNGFPHLRNVEVRR